MQAKADRSFGATCELLWRKQMDERQQHADQPADDRAVQANELEVGADPTLDLLDELIVGQRLEILADRHADLMMMAADDIDRRRAHPAVERRPVLGIFQERDDRLAKLRVDHLRETARAIRELVFDLLPEPAEALTHERRGLEALEERFADALDLLDRGRVALREPRGDTAKTIA